MSEWSSILTSFIGPGPRTPARQVSYRGKSSSSRGRLRRRGRGRWSHVSARRLSQPDADIADDRRPEVNGREFGDTIVNSKRKFVLCPPNFGPKARRG